MEIVTFGSTTTSSTTTMAGNAGDDNVRDYNIWDIHDPNSERAYFYAFSAGPGSNASLLQPALMMTQQNVHVEQSAVVSQFMGEGTFGIEAPEDSCEFCGMS